jgi:sigma-B regulation protein RsbU (phosphoserine phosphatase)
MADTETLKLQRNLSALVEFSRIVNSSLDLNFTLNNLLFSCLGKFLTTKGFVVIEEQGVACIKTAKGIHAEAIATFNSTCHSVSNEESLMAAYTLLGASVVEKISSSRKDLGYIALGEKITKQPYSQEEKDFLRTILNIAGTAIENALNITELKQVNRDLDSRINRLSSLFELSKEFGLLTEESRISRLLAYSLLGHFLSSIYAIIIFEDKKAKILETTIHKGKLKDIVDWLMLKNIDTHYAGEDLEELNHDLVNLKVEIVVPMKMQNETKGLILLGKRVNTQSYGNSDIEFIYSIGSLAIISLENKRLFREALEKQKLEEELELAKDIQQNLLPKEIPQMPSFEIAATSISSKQVGGDYYDIIKKDEEKYFVAIGDVSGKGVPAALLMANLQAFLKSICTQNVAIDVATGTINDLVSENTSDGKFITFFWGIIDNAAKTLSYVNAGHNPPLLIRNGEIIYLDKGGIILGVMKTFMPYVSETVQLESGDLIVLFTDGVTEAKSPEDEEFTDEKLEAEVKDVAGLDSGEILEKIKHSVYDHANGAFQSDDITIIVIKVL